MQKQVKMRWFRFGAMPRRPRYLPPSPGACASGGRAAGEEEHIADGVRPAFIAKSGTKRHSHPLPGRRDAPPQAIDARSASSLLHLSAATRYTRTNPCLAH
jgi:hypothetical protein